MIKKLLFFVVASACAFTVSAQSIDSTFFTKVDYIGAFDKTNDWTADWTEFDPVNAEYAEPTVTKGNGEFTRATGIKITSNETWSGTILLDGWVYVQGGTLTIEAGTVIRGTNKSALIIEQGGKINAVGTANSPIVFTSSQGAGLRQQSDWAGLVICGNAVTNKTTDLIAEGGIDSPFGGSDDNESSGILQYVRIEFPGFEVATGKEINGLSMYSVGRGTVIDHIQVSYSGDDAYEWFGGAVNCKYLISFKTEDDDFDTDNGYKGMVQFGVILRSNDVVDTDAANGFESDNDADGSATEPFTKGIFSNISAFGPAITATEPASLAGKHAEGSAMRLRRNTRLGIYNSIFYGFGRGLRVESLGSINSLGTDGGLIVKNTIIAGIRDQSRYMQADSAYSLNILQPWFNNAANANDSIMGGLSSDFAVDAYNYTAPNFLMAASADYDTASVWYEHVNAIGEVNSQSVMVTIAPNVVSQEAKIQIDNKNNEVFTFSLIDLSGRQVVKIAGLVSEGSFGRGNLAAGVYAYRVVGSKGSLAKGKLVIK